MPVRSSEAFTLGLLNRPCIKLAFFGLDMNGVVLLVKWQVIYFLSACAVYITFYERVVGEKRILLIFNPYTSSGFLSFVRKLTG